MQDKPETLTPEQVNFACKMFKTWMVICNENNRGTSWIDLDHSALLRRLLAGKPLHENPPPKRYSYPAWEMVEADEIEINEIHEIPDHVIYDSKKTVLYQGPVISIDQGAEYIWEDKENKILKHVRLGLRWKYEEREVIPDIKCLRKGLIPEEHKYQGMFLRRIHDTPTQ